MILWTLRARRARNMAGANQGTQWGPIITSRSSGDSSNTRVTGVCRDSKLARLGVIQVLLPIQMKHSYCRTTKWRSCGGEIAGLFGLFGNSNITYAHT